MASLKNLPLWQKLVVACVGCAGFALIVAVLINFIIS